MISPVSASAGLGRRPMPEEQPQQLLQPDSTAQAGILSRPNAEATTAFTVVMSLTGFAALAVVPISPTAARDLDGVPLFPMVAGCFMAVTLLGGGLGGHWSDQAGTPRPCGARHGPVRGDASGAGFQRVDRATGDRQVRRRSGRRYGRSFDDDRDRPLLPGVPAPLHARHDEHELGPPFFGRAAAPDADYGSARPYRHGRSGLHRISGPVGGNFMSAGKSAPVRCSASPGHSPAR